MSKALIVDDSSAVRMILNRILSDLGYETREAANGIEALDVMRAEGDSVNLALVDWNMPEMNGLELVLHLRDKPELSGLQIVMVTSEAEIERIAAALDAGANEYVMKPFTKDIVMQKLELLGLHA